jgi:hypothetical protein
LKIVMLAWVISFLSHPPPTYYLDLITFAPFHSNSKGKLRLNFSHISHEFGKMYCKLLHCITKLFLCMLLWKHFDFLDLSVILLPTVEAQTGSSLKDTRGWPRTNTVLRLAQFNCKLQVANNDKGLSEEDLLTSQ